MIKDLEKISTNGLKPDTTFLLNISVSSSLKRRKSKHKDRIESEGQVFLEKVCLGFTNIAKEENWMIISAEKDVLAVKKDIENKLKELFS